MPIDPNQLEILAWDGKETNLVGIKGTDAAPLAFIADLDDKLRYTPTWQGSIVAMSHIDWQDVGPRERAKLPEILILKEAGVHGSYKSLARVLEDIKNKGGKK